MTKRATLLAWHFVADTLRDGRPIPADGELLRHDGPMVLCESGLHASIQAIDALTYAPGNTVCRVRMAGDIQYGPDKILARERTILWRLDATDVLLAFGRQCALDVAYLWDMPDVVRRYLETGEDALRETARVVAWAAAGAAARAASWAAAGAGASVVGATARAAASAVGAAAEYTAETAAWAAVWAEQNARLEAAIYAAVGRTPEDDR